MFSYDETSERINWALVYCFISYIQIMLELIIFLKAIIETIRQYWDH